MAKDQNEQDQPCIKLNETEFKEIIDMWANQCVLSVLEKDFERAKYYAISYQAAQFIKMPNNGFLHPNKEKKVQNA